MSNAVGGNASDSLIDRKRLFLIRFLYKCFSMPSKKKGKKICFDFNIIDDNTFKRLKKITNSKTNEQALSRSANFVTNLSSTMTTLKYDDLALINKRTKKARLVKSGLKLKI